MGKYSKVPQIKSKTVRARADGLRCHFKIMHETSRAISGMSLKRANRYLWNVINQRECVPIRRFKGGAAHHAQAHAWNAAACRWPKKSSEMLLDLLRNAKASAKAKGLNTGMLKVSHIQSNRAQKLRRRTFRAHGRINPYESSPAHVELFLTEDPSAVVKRTGRKAKKVVAGKKSKALPNGATATPKTQVVAAQ